MVGALSLSLTVAACDADDGPARDGPIVVATTSILGDIASSVVGDEGRVEVLIPIGVDAHDFVPSARQAALAAAADLVVSNGLGLEAGLGDLLASAAGDGIPTIELAPLVEPLPFTTPEDGGRDREDPHFWMDPFRVGVSALELGEALTATHPGRWRERAAAYASDMETTDETVAELLAPIPGDRRKMITNHQAFGYFAARYGFEILGVVIRGGSTLASPSSAQLAELVQVMEQEDARVIFAETSQPTRLAESVAAELGEEVEIVELFTESLGGPGSGAETLSEMLSTNARRIAAALG
ncbi:MAG: metal ABC transporter solute-binding protein, Zn/Mn family [Acidimicrobiia bacterium]